ncbi:hypothetical protein QUD64_07425 [Lactococcus cremoris]|uniref:hypothetical protein n=1 Tax=Lactococcus lactis subsp. cremoris TaxID=1359 RepID=UPI0025A02FF9|nr:hypothetical protein [Lactococcus cremoris]MDM7654013.1 hypothetical protein [Lactococcus cremoris]
MTIIASNSLTLSNISDGTGIANVTNFYLASNQSTGIEKPADVVNLIRNGAYPTNTNYWYRAMTVSQHNLYYNGQKKLFLLATTGPSEIVAASNRFDVKRNTNYSLSFYALAAGNVKSSDVFFLGRKSNETNGFTSVNLIINSRRFSGSKTEYVTITFNSGDNDNGYIRFDNNGSSDGNNAVLYFGEVMLVEGREPKPWVAAIEDSGWTRIPQQTTYANRFLWNYRIELYSDGVTKSIEPTVIGVYGEKGDPGKDGIAGKDGVGIKTTIITYAISTNETTAPATGWTSSVPSLIKGQYLWTKTVWTYTDNSSETGYSVTYIAKDGNNGHDGIAGKDGVGIKKTTITYAVGTSGTTAPASGWNSQVPNVPAGQYLWTKTVWDYTDKTSETGYSVSKFGEKGPKGDQGVQGIQGVDGRQGIPGPKGADGKTQYTHIAYANSADGSKDFSTSDSNRAYIGMYVDFNINDSNTPSDYSWTLVKGADGTQGTPGKPGTDGKTPYFHTAWSYSADGKDRFTTVYPNLNLFEGSEKYTKDNPRTLSSNATDGWTGVDDVFVKNLKAGTYTMSGKSDAPWVNHGDWSGKQGKVGLWLMSTTPGLNVWINLGDTVPKTIEVPKDGDYCVRVNTYSNGKDIETHKFWDFKLEPGSIATPYMPSSSEVTTADWPSFIGQYTDFTQADSANPYNYTWSLIRGNDGKDGATGPQGPAGSNGNPGKVVSDTEPTTKFKGLTWKYIGITAIDASDGTNIQPNTEYYWNGKNWVIYLINVQNIYVEKLTALTANLGDATAGSLTVEKGATGGIAVKDGLVKSWDVSKMTDSNYPDRYSYTSMGVALNSGGLTFYSAGYGINLDKGGVIDPKYEVASLQAIASNGRNSGGTGLVLNATDSDFPFTINGYIDVIGRIRQTSKTTSVTIGAGLTLSLERRGETVIAILDGEINSSLYPGQQFSVGQIPLGYQPNRTVNIPVHMSGTYNGAHIDVGFDGFGTWWGPSTDTGYPRGSQTWFTDDPLLI